MCIDFDGHHSSGSSFVYVNDFCYYRNCLYTHRYNFISEKKKKQVKSPSPVSRTSGRDKLISEQRFSRFWRSLCLGYSR